MMSAHKTFTANGVQRFDGGNKPAVTVFSDPMNPGKWIGCVENTDCSESINGYSYDELLSIRNALTDALNEIDVRETVAEFNSKNPAMDSFRD
jgi:hypothetical protein